MTIPITLTVGNTVQNTNGTLFKILETNRPGGNPPVVAEDTTSGEIQYFYADGTADNILHANLVLSVANAPVNDMNPNLTITQGVTYVTRNNQKVRCDGPSSQEGKFTMRHVDNPFDLFGYPVWSTGMKSNDGSHTDDDVRDIVGDPATVQGWMYVDAAAPSDKTLWGSFMSSPPDLSATPSGKRLMYVAMRERTTNTQTFSLYSNTR